MNRHLLRYRAPKGAVDYGITRRRCYHDKTLGLRIAFGPRRYELLWRFCK